MLEALSGYLSSHPGAAIVGGILIILILMNFLVKSVIKLIVVVFFVFLLVMGYYHFKEPDDMKTSLTQSVGIIGSGISEIKDKGKSFYKDGKELLKKTKDAPGTVNKMLDTSDKEVKKEMEKK